VDLLGGSHLSGVAPLVGHLVAVSIFCLLANPIVSVVLAVFQRSKAALYRVLINTVSGYRPDTDSTTRGTVDDSGNVQLNTDSTARTRAQTSGVTFLTVPNPKKGAALWSNRKTWGSGLVGLAFARSATRSLVKELRKRIGEQESDSKEVGEVDSAPGANTPEANAMVAEQYRGVFIYKHDHAAMKSLWAKARALKVGPEKLFHGVR
jgi:hypothetical protein